MNKKQIIVLIATVILIIISLTSIPTLNWKPNTPREEKERIYAENFRYHCIYFPTGIIIIGCACFYLLRNKK
ncbi:MAG: hypothetical protein A4E64_01579 [Syntrophorhabdus sp. PtaU1.Bin058]|nr:MAG: hypothetical protein A4E64_01579 [Syntrophorhabdus sp. PtaU1.Bin058]